MSERAAIAVHQLLHGYDGGHTLLGASVKLDESASATAMLLSDLAPSEPPTDDGWLVGYPLQSAESFVIARTWPAPEMGRPGCVWTHSILVSYASLARLPSLSALAGLLTRPARGEFDRYNLPLTLPVDVPVRKLPRHLFSQASRVLRALYEDGRPVVVQVDRAPDGERLAIAIWDQQWPRLRRRMRFCTTGVSAAELDTVGFDLTFARSTASLQPQSKAQLLRLEGDRPRRRQPGWLVASLGDLRQGGGPFREALRRYGADVTSGRRAFPVVAACALVELGSRASAGDLDSLIQAFEQRLGEAEARTAQSALVRALISQAKSLSQRALTYAIQHIDTVEDHPDVSVQPLVSSAWDRDRRAFWRNLWQHPAASVAAHSVVRQQPAEAVLAAISEKDAPIADILLLRPDLLAKEEVWRSPAAFTASELAARSVESQRYAASGIYDSGAIDLLPVLHGFGAELLLDTFLEKEPLRGDGSLSEFDRQWLGLATQTADSRMRALASCGHRATVMALARQTSPGDLANRGDDPWLLAWNRAVGSVSQTDWQFFAAYLLARAFLHPASVRATLLLSSYETVVRSLYDQTLHDEVVALLDPLVPEPGLWMFFWGETKASKLRNGLGRAIADAGIPPDRVIAEAPREIAEHLVRSMATSQRGIALLQSAQRNLAGTLPRPRLALLDKALDRASR